MACHQGLLVGLCVQQLQFVPPWLTSRHGHHCDQVMWKKSCGWSQLKLNIEIKLVFICLSGCFYHLVLNTLCDRAVFPVGVACIWNVPSCTVTAAPSLTFCRWLLHIYFTLQFYSSFVFTVKCRWSSLFLLMITTCHVFINWWIDLSQVVE